MADMRINGKKMKVPLQGMIGIILLGEDYAENWKTQILERLIRSFPKSSVVDVGANVGQTLLQLRSLSAEVTYVGFEANPRAVSYLNALVEANDFARTTIISAALGSETGLVDLLIQGPVEYTDQSASMIADLRPDRTYAKATVIVVPFDTVFASLAVPVPRIIKIDVEGAELEVLRGMSQTLATHRPVIVCEVLLSDMKADKALMDTRNLELMRLLDQHGYTVWRLVKTRWDLSGVSRVRTFPSGFWTPERAEECDYLFLPDEEIDPILGKLALPILD